MRRIIMLLFINVLIALLALTFLQLSVLFPHNKECIPSDHGCLSTLEFIMPSWKNIQIIPFIVNSFSNQAPEIHISAAIEYSVKYFVGIVSVLFLGEYIYFKTKGSRK